LLIFVVVLTCSVLVSPAFAQDEQQSSSRGVSVFLSWLPLLILIGLWFLIFKAFPPKRQRDLLEKQDVYLDRATEHMENVESKLDAILEELKTRRES
jgi:hypothetical protein